MKFRTFPKTKKFAKIHESIKYFQLGVFPLPHELFIYALIPPTNQQPWNEHTAVHYSRKKVSL